MFSLSLFLALLNQIMWHELQNATLQVNTEFQFVHTHRWLVPFPHKSTKESSPLSLWASPLSAPDFLFPSPYQEALAYQYFFYNVATGAQIISYTFSLMEVSIIVSRTIFFILFQEMLLLYYVHQLVDGFVSLMDLGSLL